jgi:hypothetical protein
MEFIYIDLCVCVCVTMWLQLLYVGSSALHIGYFCALFKIPRHENCALLGCYAAGSGKKLPRVVVRNYRE